MKLWVVVALAACGHASGGQHEAAPAVLTGPIPDAAPEVVPAPLPPPQVVNGGAKRAAIEAPHAGGIIALAMSPDGRVALSCDELAGTRLWPALDGSREPIVVDLPQPRQLAVAVTGDGYQAIVLDQGGGLYVAQLDRDGTTRSHTSFEPDPAFVAVAMSGGGAIAWRADQTLTLIAPDGRVHGRIAVGPGERLVAIAASGGRAAALVDSGTKRRARWIATAPALAWGGWIDAVDAGDELALSPSGTRVATIEHVEGKAPTLHAYEVSPGHSLANVAIGDARGIGFSDDDHVAYGLPRSIGWMPLTGAAKVSATEAFASATPRVPIASGGNRVISASAGELVIASPDANQYLGYALESPSVAQVAGEGHLLIGLGTTLVELDKSLATARQPSLPFHGDAALAELRWLGGDDWLVEVTDGEGKTELAIADLAHGTQHELRSKMASVPVLMYEPSTRLVTLSLGDTPEVDRYDPGTHKLERVASLARPKGYEQAELVPLAPARAGGAELVRVTMREKPTIQWVHDARDPGKAAASVSVDGASFAGADPAGHVFLWRTTPSGQLELGVYDAGKPIGKLPNDGPVALWPAPSGDRVIEVGQRSVALFKLDGTRLWVQALAGTTEALWLSDGAIAVISAAGIARLDPASGAVTAARCGWGFGLSAKPHPESPRIEPACVQLEH
ncbi:MAG TPA: WD40 repeat domain-containing protein [Kofleriaceae bacterium]|nr:WD40 repeat domain-containing protein [Kofleriaceae bacterium]